MQCGQLWVEEWNGVGGAPELFTLLQSWRQEAKPRPGVVSAAAFAAADPASCYAPMIADPSTVDLVVRALFLFGYAVLFAAVEIEIEGSHGWAERLPTWFRVTTPSARFYGLFMRGKPLTGYHAVMFVLPLWSFHIGFVGGVPWSWAAEADDAVGVPGVGRDLGPAVVPVQPALRLGAVPQGPGLVARPHLDRPLPRRLLGRARAVARDRGHGAPDDRQTSACWAATSGCAPGSWR